MQTKYLTVKEAADFLKKSVRAIGKALEGKRFDDCKLCECGNSWLISKDSLIKYKQVVDSRRRISYSHSNK